MENGRRKLENGNWKIEKRKSKLEPGNWKLENRNWKLRTRKSELEIGNLSIDNTEPTGNFELAVWFSASEI